MSFRFLFSAGRRYAALLALGSFQLLPSSNFVSLDAVTKSYAWGWNNFGQLGLGHAANQQTPQNITALGPNIAQVTGNSSCSVAVTVDGKVYSWGKSKRGVLGHPHSSESNLNIPTLIDALNGEVIRQVACSNSTKHKIRLDHMACVNVKGEVLTWGNPDHGKLGHSFETQEQVVMKNHYQTGKAFNSGQIPQKIKIDKPVKQVACAQQHTVCLTEEGSVYVFGLNKRGSLGFKSEQPEIATPTKLALPERITKVATGSDFTVALSESGKLYAWGSNYFGQLGNPNQLYVEQPQVIQGFTLPVSDFACGDQFIGAIDTDGRLYTWGYGGDGQLGYQNKQDIPVPRIVEFAHKAKSISCGLGHVGVITNDNQLYMFGRGKEGQLGRGSEIESPNSYRIAPQLVEQFKGRRVLQVACCGSHTLAIVA